MLSTVLREYERYFNKWKVSGNHGGFGKAGVPKPFSDFTTVNSLLYLHEFVYQFPDVLSKVLGELPEWAFKESLKKDNKQKHFEKEKKRRVRSNPNEAAFKHFNRSNDKKNKIVQYGMLTETSLKIETTLCNKRAQKRELLNERSKETKVSKRVLKKRFIMWSESKLKKDTASIDDSSSDDDGITSSQEEFFEEMMEIDKSIDTTKERQNYIEGEISKMQQDEKEN